MPVFMLWSAPRSRSTAFFRSMLERGDLVALHEPLEGLAYVGPIEVEGRTFASVPSLVAWLLDGTQDIGVFVKETVNRRVLDVVRSDHRFLAGVRHAFLLRRPEEIAVSWYALEHDMRIEDAALVLLEELHTAVCEAGGEPVVIDSDDLLDRPEATMAACCAALGLPFLPDALRWEPGERVEWERSARWHRDVSVTSGFETRIHPDRDSLEARDEIARFVARQQPSYERLRAHRIELDAPDRASRRPLYHLALASDWSAAVAAGSYRVSTLGRSLDDVGFIHCSFPHQVGRIADLVYRGRDDVVLLEIDPSLLTCPVVVEVGDHDTGEEYPHLYGPLNLDAVVHVGRPRDVERP